MYQRAASIDLRVGVRSRTPHPGCRSFRLCTFSPSSEEHAGNEGKNHYGGDLDVGAEASTTTIRSSLAWAVSGNYTLGRNATDGSDVPVGPILDSRARLRNAS
jgi:hypothetical protein